MRFVRTLLFVVILLALSTVALADPSCNPPASGNWEIQNTSVLCDNGTAITIQGNINLTNASLNITNGTILNASAINLVDVNSSLFMNESCETNATLLIWGGNLTMTDDALVTNTVNIAPGADVIVSDGADIQGNIYMISAGTKTLTVTDTELNPTGFAHVTGTGLITITNTNITTTGDVDFSGDATASITDMILTGANVSVNNNALLTANDTLFNLTGNLTLTSDATATFTRTNISFQNYSEDFILMRTANTVTFIDNSSLNGTIYVYNGNLVMSDSEESNGRVYIRLYNYTNATITNISNQSNGIYFWLTEYSGLDINQSNISYISIIDNAVGRIVDSTIARLNGGSINVTDSNISTLNLSTAPSLVNFFGTNNVFENVTFEANATMNGNITFTDTTPYYFDSLALTRIFPFYIQNATGSPIVGRTVSVLRLYEDYYVTSTAAFNASIRWNASNPTLLNISNSSYSDEITMDAQGGGLYNYTGYSIAGEEYNFTVDSSVPDVTVTRFSNGASWFGTFQRLDRYTSWTDITGANGYIEPNITLTNISYNDTFYLLVQNQSFSYTLLNDTPIIQHIDGDGPIVTLNGTTQNIYADNFIWNFNVSNDTYILNYTINNGTHTWTNGSYNRTQLSALSYYDTHTYDGIYLPVGTWTLNVTAWDEYSNGQTATHTFTSMQAIEASVTGDDEAETTIGGSDVSFTFMITTKGAGSVVAAFLNMTAGALTYDSTYAILTDGDGNNASIAGGGTYAGAGNITIDPINMSNAPSYVALNLASAGTHYQETLTMIIEPYSGLSAGTYSGAYGFGVFG